MLRGLNGKHALLLHLRIYFHNMLKAFQSLNKNDYDVSILEANRDAIANEYRNNIKAYQEHMDSLPDSISSFDAVRMNNHNITANKPIKTLRPYPAYAEKWTSSWIAYNSEFYEPVKEYFPITYEILNSFENIFYAHFSSIEPGGRIKPHIGEAKENISRSQWCFISPRNTDKCFISASETLDDNTEVDIFTYSENASFKFEDDKYWHWVENNTDEERVVLLMDYWQDMSKKYIVDDYLYYRDVSKGFSL